MGFAKKILLIVVPLFFISCVSDTAKKANKEFDSQDTTSIAESKQGEKALDETKDMVDHMVDNLGSPIETVAMIKSLGIPFNSTLLAPNGETDTFTSSYQQATALGIYGADLGYLNFYGKTSLVLSYIATVKTLADELKVGQFFDYSTLKRLANNNENVDSLIYISRKSMNRIDQYLRKTQRSSISAAIVTGVWVEGMYYMTQFYKISKKERLKEAIGDQKALVNLLINVLKNYSYHPEIKELYNELLGIANIYKNVSISVVQNGDPEMVEVNGVYTVIQNEKTVINISQKQIDEITSKIMQIRSKLLGDS